MEIKIPFGIIPCAGEAKRMGNINMPKSLYHINGIPTLQTLLIKLSQFCSRFVLAINETDFINNIYKQSLSEELLSKIDFVPSVSGAGDGQAILDCLNFISNKNLKNDYNLICWGDSYIKDASIFKFLIKKISSLNEDFVVPINHVKNPYVTYLFSKKNKLSRVAFQRRGEFLNEGYTDLSVFFIKMNIKDYLIEMKKNQNLITKNKVNELNFLDLVNFMYKKRISMATINIDSNTYISSFNTVKEALNLKI